MLHLYDKCPTATEYPWSCEECSHTSMAGNGLHLNDDGKHVERLVNMMMLDVLEEISDLKYKLSLIKTSCFKRLRDEKETTESWDDWYNRQTDAEEYKRLEEVTLVQKGE